MQITAIGCVFINRLPSASWVSHILRVLHTKLRGLPCLSGLSSPFCCKRSLTAPICLTGLLHILSGFPSSSNTTYQLHQSWSKKQLLTHSQPTCKCVVTAGVSLCALCPDCLTASSSTALHTTSYYLSYPWATVSERGDACEFLLPRVEGDTGIFPRCPLHTVYREATKALPADY